MDTSLPHSSNLNAALEQEPQSLGLPRLRQLPTQPTNVILTGVAGTGKTYQLLQLQRLYDQSIELAELDLWQSLLNQVSWRETVCAVLLLEDKALKIAEITAHPLFVEKAQVNGRKDNLAQTVWGALIPYSQEDNSRGSLSDSSRNRASRTYFAQTGDKAWFILDEVKSSLTSTSPISELLALYAKNQSRHSQVIQPSGRSMTSACQAQSSALSQQQSLTTVVSRSCLVSFHQAYGYEEFVEGIRPAVGAQGQISYQIQPGAFLKLCQKAAQDPEHRYAMLIDEINRANVSRVFGELMSLIEPDKRAGQANAMQVNLAYSGRPFSVPSNVDIYATMNTQDQSLAPLDMAFRRRFQFIDCPPISELLPTILLGDESIDLSRLLTGLNRRICQVLGQDSQLGHAFLIHVTDLPQLQSVLVQQLLPQLIQATSGQADLLHHILNDGDQPRSRQFIHHQLSDHLPPEERAAYPAQSMPSSRFNMGTALNNWINPDLIQMTGEFCQVSVYQQLY